jgi:hypothetical protein
MRKPAAECLPVDVPCLRGGPLPRFAPQQAMSAVRPSNDILSDNATDNREVHEVGSSPRLQIRNGFSSPASKDGGFQARNFCKMVCFPLPNFPKINLTITNSQSKRNLCHGTKWKDSAYFLPLFNKAKFRRRRKEEAFED